MLKNAAVALLATGLSPDYLKKGASMLQWTRGPSVYEPKKAGVRTVQGRKGPKTTSSVQ
jgi:hypothetical protein